MVMALYLAPCVAWCSALWETRRTPPASSSEDFSSILRWKLGKIYVSNTLILVKKAQNVHKSAYLAHEIDFRLDSLSIP